jgi:dihydrofolate synthase/folylpolyglutamate synthase
MSSGSDRVLARLMSLHPKIIDLKLDRVERLLATLGHPERRLPPVVHIAGTNGKGSVLAMTRAGLEAMGWRVHAYTSPHLTRFSERIVLGGVRIDEDRLIALLEQLRFLRLPPAQRSSPSPRHRPRPCCSRWALAGGSTRRTFLKRQPSA